MHIKVLKHSNNKGSSLIRTVYGRMYVYENGVCLLYIILIIIIQCRILHGFYCIDI